MRMEKDFVKVETEHGYVLYKLDYLMKKKGISRNKLMCDTDTKYDTILKYARGEVYHISIDIIDRFCDYFDCEATDIIEYVRNK